MDQLLSPILIHMKHTDHEKSAIRMIRHSFQIRQMKAGNFLHVQSVLTEAQYILEAAVALALEKVLLEASTHTVALFAIVNGKKITNGNMNV